MNISKRMIWLTLTIFSILGFTSLSYAKTCSATWDTNIDPRLERVISDLNPFWGTWKGNYKDETVVAEFDIDSSAHFIVSGQLKDRTLNNKRIKVCLSNSGRLQILLSGFTMNVDIINERQIRVSHFLLSAPVTLRR